MTRAWYIGKRIVSAFVLVVVLCLVALSFWFQTDAAREEVRRGVAKYLLDNFGLVGEIGGVELQVFPPRAHVLQGQVMGRDGEPLLQVDRITVSLQSLALLQGSLRVGEVTLEQPNLRLEIEGREIVNLPELPRRQGGSSGRSAVSRGVGDLGVLAGRLEVVVRDAPDGPLAIELDNSNFDVTLEAEGAKDVRFLIGEGVVRYGDETYSIRHMGGRVLAEGEEVHLRDFVVAVDDAEVSVPRAVVGTQAPFDGQGVVSLKTPLEWIRRLPLRAPLLAGQASAEGRIVRRQGRLEVDGEASVAGLVIGPEFVGDGTSTLGPHSVGDVTVGFRYTPEELLVPELVVDRPAEGDGSIVVRNFVLSLQEDRLPLTGEIEFRQTQLAHVLIDAGLYASRVRTQLDGRAAVRGFVRDFRLRFLPLELRARNFEVLSESVLKEDPQLIMGFPDGTIRGKVVIDGDGVRLRQLTVGVGSSRLSVMAHLGFVRPRRWWLRATTEGGRAFRLDDLGPIAGLNLSGTGSLSVHIHGPYNDPVIEGQVNIRDFHLNTLPFGHVQGPVNYRRLVLNLPNVAARAGDSRYRFVDGRVDFRQGLAIDGVAHLDHLFLRDAVRILQVEGASALADGLTQGQAVVHYDGRRAAWQVDVECQVAQASYDGHRAGDVDAVVHYDGGEITVDRATIRRGPGQVEVSGRLGALGGLAMDLEVRGMTLAALDELPLFLQEATGNVRGRARLYGTTSYPRATGWLDLSPLSWRDNRWGPSRIRFGLRGREIEISGQLAGRQVRIDEARLLLQDPYPLSIRGAVEDFELSRLWNDDPFWEDLALQINGSVDAGVDLATLMSEQPTGRRGGQSRAVDYGMSGRLELSRLEARHPSFTLRNSDPLPVTLRRDRAQVPRAEFVVSSGRLDQSTAFELGGWVGPDALGLEVEGDVDLSFAPTFLEPLQTMVGTVRVDCRIGGSWAAPVFLGAADFNISRLQLAGVEPVATDLAGGLRFSRNVVVVQGFSAHVLGGGVDGSGGIVLSGFVPSSYEFNAALYDARLPLGRDSSAVFNGNLRFSSPSSNETLPLLSGVLNVARLRYSESIDLGVNLERLSRRRRAQVRTFDPRGDHLRFDLRLTGGENLRIENNLARAELIVDDASQPFRLVGTNQYQSFLGTVRLEPHGSVTFRNTDFDIERAVLEFRDPYEPNPSIDFIATAARRDWVLRLRVTGTRDDASIALSSEPPLSEEDIALLLAVGLTSEETQQLGGYGSAASSALPELLWSLTGVDDELSKLVPVLDELRITTDYSRRSGRTEPRVRVARRLSEDVRLGASAGLAETRDFEANLEIELDDNLSFEAVYENDSDFDFGNIGGDLRWLREF